MSTTGFLVRNTVIHASKKMNKYSYMAHASYDRNSCEGTAYNFCKKTKSKANKEITRVKQQKHFKGPIRYTVMVLILVLNIVCRFAELQTGVAEDGRRRDEVLHTLELSHRERDRASDLEHAKLNARLADIAEETGRRLAQCEMKLREEYVEKCAQLEKVSLEPSCLLQRFFWVEKSYS